MNTALSLLADLLTDLPLTIRAQRLVKHVRERFVCDAVGLLRLEGQALVPLAFAGLSKEALGRRFVVAQHPRFEEVLSRPGPVRFKPADPRPDPYDGLLAEYLGQPLPVHDCLGVRLSLEGRTCGVLTLDALEGRTFTDRDIASLSTFALLAQACLRVSTLEQDSRSLRLLRGRQIAASEMDLSQKRQIIGQSPAMDALLQELEVVCDSDLPVLLLGETGVGKKLLAQHVHRNSRRSDSPMIHVNCAALPESLAHSELFGKGADMDGHQGCIESADGGTLFLEEVTELALSVQVKLLRLLQAGEVTRLGDERTRVVNVRVVASSNRNLVQSVRDGQFLPDLYHRLSAYPVRVPPLRERGSDILVLTGRFLELNRARLGLHSLRLSDQAQRALSAYSWPGNVRELEHVIGRASLRALSQGAQRDAIVTIELDWLGLETVQPLSPHDQAQPSMSLRLATEAFQQQMIQSAIARHQGNWSAAARSLSLDTSNLHKLAKRLGLK